MRERPATRTLIYTTWRKCKIYCGHWEFRPMIFTPDRQNHNRNVHSVIAALLEWSKTEQITTIYDQSWLNCFVGVDERLRGSQTTCDGYAGRMTGGQNFSVYTIHLQHSVMPAPGHVFDLHGPWTNRTTSARSGFRWSGAHDSYGGRRPVGNACCPVAR